jgi:hypothetical protein
MQRAAASLVFTLVVAGLITQPTFPAVTRPDPIQSAVMSNVANIKWEPGKP